jgi:hypothetical protein
MKPTTTAMATDCKGFLRIGAVKLSCTASTTSVMASRVTSVTLGGLSIDLSIGKHLNQIELVPKTMDQVFCSASSIGRGSRLAADRAGEMIHPSMTATRRQQDRRRREMDAATMTRYAQMQAGQHKMD